MKVWATILVLVVSVVGFAFSYEFAYRNIVKMLRTPHMEKTELVSAKK
jgi:hypothetical protein